MKAWYIGDEVGQIYWSDTESAALAEAGYSDEPENLRLAQRVPKFDGEPRTLTPREWIEADFGFQCNNCWEMAFPQVERICYDSAGNVYCEECGRERRRAHLIALLRKEGK